MAKSQDTQFSENLGGESQQPHTGSQTAQGGEQTVTQDMGQKIQNLRQKSGQVATQVGTQLNKNLDQAMNVTASGLDTTSTRISRMANYFREKDSTQLKTDMGSMIQRKPMQSVLVGVVLGFLVGRLFR
jgi:ElaB/YqjD/DUF883 family membrane-anchored ribosome-binding protein